MFQHLWKLKLSLAVIYFADGAVTIIHIYDYAIQKLAKLYTV